MSVIPVAQANEKGRIDSTEHLLREVPVAFADTNERNVKLTKAVRISEDKNENDMASLNNHKIINDDLKVANNNIDGKINRAYTSPDIELQNYNINEERGVIESSSQSMSAVSRLHSDRLLHSDDEESSKAYLEDGVKNDDSKTKEKESALSNIGADYMRINGAIGSSFRQLQKPQSMQSLPTSSKMSYSNEDSGIAPLVVGVDGSKYGMEDKENKEKQKPNVGYRLGKRKTLYEKRRKISDYCLAFGISGIVLMIVETELTMAEVYDKVRLTVIWFLSIHCTKIMHTLVYITADTQYCLIYNKLITILFSFSMLMSFV